jgi:hypothetical protein
VIFVNNEKQISGKLRKQDWKLDVGGKVEAFQSSDQMDYVRMDPTKAYPNKELKSWKRHVVLDKPEITLVMDEIEAEAGSEIEIRFHPGVEFSIHEGIVFLQGNKGNMALIPIADEELNIQPGKHASQYINLTYDFTWIEYFDTELTSSKERSIIGTIILPVENIEDAIRISRTTQLIQEKSGDLSISFSRDGVHYSYDFKNRKGVLGIE